MIKNIQARERKSNIIKLKLQDKKKDKIPPQIILHCPSLSKPDVISLSASNIRHFSYITSAKTKDSKKRGVVVLEARRFENREWSLGLINIIQSDVHNIKSNS